MAERYKRRILQHVAHHAYEPREADALAEELGVSEEDYEAFREALQALIDAGQVVSGASDTIALPPMGHEVTGRFKQHPRGFGFILPDQPNAHGDLFIPAGSTGDAITGDIVRAQVIHRKRKGPAGKSPFVGRIVEVVERRNTRFVGTLEKRGNYYLVNPDGTAMTDPIVVRDPTAKHARLHQKVVVELTHYPEEDQLPEGVITEVLGEAGEPDTETLSVCRAYNLAEEFPQPVLDEAREQIRRFNEDPETFGGDRVDIRDTFLVTIDPPEAQDFDDAISLEQTEDGVELGIHIADVAAFVRPGSHLDEEAYQRGNSAYLPRTVLPMLPEVLSNGVCSLQPDVDRVARSTFITYDDRGNVKNTRFARTHIRSNYRLTYLEAQALIDDDPEEAAKHAKHETPYTDQLIDTLKGMDQLARTIRKRRFRKGMITLDLPEVELRFDEHGHVVDAQPEDDAFTHTIIEMFMVEANEAVARLFADLDVPLLRRIHPDPGAHDVTELRTFARVAGYNIPENPSHKELQKLLDAVRDKPAAKAVHFAVLKTLTKAEYSPELIGHFALASDHYAHSTSPIRRYPDLTVHRALDVLDRHLDKHRRVPKSPDKRRKLARRVKNDPDTRGEDALHTVGSHCSHTERNAEGAERELRKFLVLQLLEQHIGEDYAGTVTGVTGFGVFVQIDKYVIEGMVHTDNLPGAPRDQWRLNKDTGSIVAERSGRSITIGDQFSVRVNRVDLARREMDLLIIEETVPTPGKDGKGKKPQRGSSDDKRSKKPKKTGAKAGGGPKSKGGPKAKGDSPGAKGGPKNKNHRGKKSGSGGRSSKRSAGPGKRRR
jgi:ribonuclease R